MVPMSLREKVEDIVREFLGTQPATSPPLACDPIQEPASAKRQKLFDQLVTLQQQHELAVLPLRAEEARLEGMLNEILMHVEDLTRQLTNVRGEEFIVNINASVAIDKALNDLRESASKTIKDFLVKMNTELDRLIRLKPQYSRGVGELDLVTLAKPKFTFSDAPQISRRVSAVRAAINRAEQLKVVEISEDELVAEFESLRANLPTIDGELEPIVGD